MSTLETDDDLRDERGRLVSVVVEGTRFYRQDAPIGMPVCPVKGPHYPHNFWAGGSRIEHCWGSLS